MVERLDFEVLALLFEFVEITLLARLEHFDDLVNVSVVSRITESKLLSIWYIKVRSYCLTKSHAIRN
jgi:hypothetical protein